MLDDDSAAPPGSTLSMPRVLRLRRPSLRVAAWALPLALLLVACGGIVAKPVAWQAVRVGANDKSLTLTFALDTCQSLDRIEVAYGRSSITITMFEAPNHSPCTGLRFARPTDVPLRVPLGGRTVVDGAVKR